MQEAIKKEVPLRNCNRCRQEFQPPSRYIFTCRFCKHSCRDNYMPAMCSLNLQIDGF